MKHWNQVRPEVAQRLMAAVDEYEKTGRIDPHYSAGIELGSALELARAEAAPKLRTKAEVDAEIVALMRELFSCRYVPVFTQSERIGALCAEPLAPDSEQPPLCPECERPMSRYGGAGDSGWTCIVCNAAGDADRDHPEAVEACSCEEALALRKKLEAVDALLLSLRQRSHAFSRGTVTRDVLERLFMELSECLK